MTQTLVVADHLFARAGRPEMRKSTGARQILRHARDPGHIQETVGAYVARHQMRVAAGSVLNTNLRRLHHGSLGVYSLAYGAPVEWRIGADSRTYLVLLAGGTGGSLATGGRVVPLTPAVVSPGTTAVLRWPREAFVTMLCIPRRAIANAARLSGSAAPLEPVLFEPMLDTNADRAGTWLALARTFTGSVENGSIAGSPVAMAYFEQLLVHGLLAAQPNSTRRPSTSADDGLPAGLVAAMAYCDHHTGLPPTIGDIAAAAHVSKRTLQSQFRLYLSTTPQNYLRDLRLGRVHRELLEAADERPSTTVTAIAHRHGFHHMGRFAVQYRAKFGRAPSETLKGSRPGE